jgi:hypothetical protein
MAGSILPASWVRFYQLFWIAVNTKVLSRELNCKPVFFWMMVSSHYRCSIRDGSSTGTGSDPTVQEVLVLFWIFAFIHFDTFIRSSGITVLLINSRQSFGLCGMKSPDPLLGLHTLNPWLSHTLLNPKYGTAERLMFVTFVAQRLYYGRWKTDRVCW